MDKKKIVRITKILIGASFASIFLFLWLVLSNGDEVEGFSSLIPLVLFFACGIIIAVTGVLLLVECVLELITECREQGIKALGKFAVEIATYFLVFLAVNVIGKNRDSVWENFPFAVMAVCTRKAMDWLGRKNS